MMATLFTGVELMAFFSWRNDKNPPFGRLKDNSTTEYRYPSHCYLHSYITTQNPADPINPHKARLTIPKQSHHFPRSSRL
jgi:hypothetical protein